MSLIGFGKSASGADALIVDGHELPVSMLAVVGTIIAALLVLRARSSGANVVAVGTPAAASTTPAQTALTSPVDLAPYNADSAALSTLESSVNSLQNTVAGLQTAPPPAVTAPTPTPAPAPAPAPTPSLLQQDQTFLDQYANSTGPITHDQALTAAEHAFEVGLGRAPGAGPGLDAFANQIVAEQSYGPTLSGIVFGTEGLADIAKQPATPPTAGAGGGPSVQPVTVKHGDSLPTIAQAWMGDAALAPHLAQLNGISNSDALRVGDVLLVPR